MAGHLADPAMRWEPWSRETGMDRAADNHYATSTLQQIKAIDVGAIAAEVFVLFLWATVPMLPQALDVLQAWGFAYKSMWIWDKEICGTGYWNRNRHEILMAGTRGGVPAPPIGTQWPSIVAERRRGHSIKPEWGYRMIEQFYPSLPKIELFARTARTGWDSWGWEAPGTAAAVRPLPTYRELADEEVTRANGDRTAAIALVRRLLDDPVRRERLAQLLAGLAARRLHRIHRQKIHRGRRRPPIETVFAHYWRFLKCQTRLNTRAVRSSLGRKSR